MSIPGEAATLTADETARAARTCGMQVQTADSVQTALTSIAANDPQARVLICGSLYLAGMVLRTNA